MQTAQLPVGRGSLSLFQWVAAALMAALTGVLAWLVIPLPFSPVPVTGQTFGVMMAGALLGPRGGALSMVLLLVLGLAGVPVFSGGQAGPGVLFGPTGGYLLAFPLAAWLIGWLGARAGLEAGFWRWLGIHIVGGMALVYLLGAVQLSLVTGIGSTEAFLWGAASFLPGDILKATAAATVSGRLSRTWLRRAAL